MLTVVAAAILDANGLAVSLPPPARHHTIIAHMVARGYKTPISGEQGFILSNGRFARRKPALRIAQKANQIKKKCGCASLLFSEDLW